MAKKILVVVVLTVMYLNAVDCRLEKKCCEEYCYDSDGERSQWMHMGARTAYRNSRGSDSGHQFVFENCTATKIWMVVRHGTRSQSRKYLALRTQLSATRDEIVKNYEVLNQKPEVGALCEGDLNLLKQWQLEQNLAPATITEQGLNETRHLADSYQRAFPDIFEETLDEQKLYYRYTDVASSPRNLATFKVFIDQLYGENAHQSVKTPLMAYNSIVLDSYVFCPPWRHYANYHNREDGTEYAKFQKSELYAQTMRDISSRLGFENPLTNEQIDIMHDTCRHELAIFAEKPSAWCAAFTPNEINVLEYLEDLEYFYTFGHGHESNTEMQCKGFADMLKHLKSKDWPKVVAYFAHSSTVRFMLTALGVGKDSEKMRSDNYLSQANRTFRSSVLFPYGGNLAAVKYECSGGKEREKVAFFLNEKPLDFSWCESGLCKLSDVLETFKRFSRGDCETTFCRYVSTTLE